MSLRFSKFCLRTLGVVTAAFVLAANLSAVNQVVIFTFDGKNGAHPQSALITDASGRLYGTTSSGGADQGACRAFGGCGTVFALASNHGVWSHRPLYAFKGGASDGQQPRGNIVFDAAGSIYGVTEFGGPASTPGAGAVYRISPSASGAWTETILHFFGTGLDGFQPNAGVAKDASGNLFGTTRFGGAHGAGTVYELTPNSDGSWTETVIYSFGAQSHDGTSPLTEVSFDTNGNLFGTTESGGSSNAGTIFELSPSSGGWSETVVHSFKVDAGFPNASLLLDSSGNFYGTAAGSEDGGVVFELRASDGGWSYHALYQFLGYQGNDGGDPFGPLVFDLAGNLYGTTQFGGTGGSNEGTVYKLQHRSDGRWSESLLHSFNQSDGSEPQTGVIFGKPGVLYGTAFYGGSSNAGVVFKITP
jgi:uncharacterized repeat protein (TIGR03803 family)